MIYFVRNKAKERENWHNWFAWYPVTVDYTEDGDGVRVWWQTVQRKMCIRYGYMHCYTIRHYRLLPN